MYGRLIDQNQSERLQETQAPAATVESSPLVAPVKPVKPIRPAGWDKDTTAVNKIAKELGFQTETIQKVAGQPTFRIQSESYNPADVMNVLVDSMSPKGATNERGITGIIGDMQHVGLLGSSGKITDKGASFLERLNQTPDPESLVDDAIGKRAIKKETPGSVIESQVQVPIADLVKQIKAADVVAHNESLKKHNVESYLFKQSQADNKAKTAAAAKAAKEAAAAEVKRVAQDQAKLKIETEAQAAQRLEHAQNVYTQAETEGRFGEKAPDTFDIKRELFKEGEAPGVFNINVGDRVMPFEGTEAEVKAKVDRLTAVREKEAEKIQQKIDEGTSPAQKKQAEIEQMEALGQHGSTEHTDAVKEHKRLMTRANLDTTEDTSKLHELHKPVTYSTVGNKPLTREGHTIYEDGEAKATVPTRKAAEEHILTNASREKIEALAKSKHPWSDRAKEEIKRRDATSPTTGIVDESVFPATRDNNTPIKEMPERPETVDKTDLPKTAGDQIRDARIDELTKLLKPLLDKFGLKDVALNIASKIANNADGSYEAKIIKLAMDSKNPIQTLRHEGIHALKELGFFTEQQWKALESQAEKVWVNKYLKGVIQDGETGQTRYAAYVEMGLTEQEILEEAIADAFADFDASKAPPGMLAAILNRLRLFFNGLKSAFTGAGYDNFEDVFGKIERGELKAGEEAAVEEPSNDGFENREKPTKEDERKADAYEEAHGIRSYVPEPITGVPVKTKYSFKMDDKYGFDPITFMPLNEDGTVTAYYHTTKANALAFKQWFGDSKVVDENGKPLVVYHGTKNAPTEFTKKRTGYASTFLGDYEVERHGIFAAESNELAEEYANQGEKPIGQTVMPLYMRIEDPLDTVDGQYTDGLWNRIEKAAESLGAESPYRTARYIGNLWSRGELWKMFDADENQDPAWNIALLKEAGFDGMRIYERSEGDVENTAAWVAFDPTQVKSAIGNNGQFDGANPDIRYSLRGIPSEPGTEPIPKGHVRLYHQTSATALGEIERSGLNIANAKGIEGPKSIYAGETPFYGDAKSRPTLEFHVPKDQWDAPFVLSDVKPEQFIAAHYPWHETVRHLESTPESLQAALDGKFDKREGNEKIAVDYVKANHGSKPKLSLRAQIGNLNNGHQLNQRVAATTYTRIDKGHVGRMMDALIPKSFSSMRQRIINKYNQAGVVGRAAANILGDRARLADASAEGACLFSDNASSIAAESMGVGGRKGGTPTYKKTTFQAPNENGVMTNYEAGHFTVDGNSKGLVEIFSPLAKQGDPYIYQLYNYWAGVKRGTRFLADGTEDNFDPSDIAYAQQIEGLHPEFVNVQKEWIKYNDGLVKMMVDAGVLTKEAGVEFTKHGDYLPFYRQLEGDSTIGPNIFQSIAGVKPPKKHKGNSDAPIGDFLENVVRNTQAAIEASMKNVAAQRVMRDAMLTGQAVQVPYNTPLGDNIVPVFQNGIKTLYKVQDALLVEAMKGLNLPEISFIGLVAAPANLLRTMVTKDPAFMLANMMRDSLSAYGTTGAKMIPIVDTIKNFGLGIAGVDPVVRILNRAGMGGGFDFAGNVETSGREFSKALRKFSGTRTNFEKGMTPFTGVWQALEHMSDASEMATRVQVYKSTMDRTGNEAEAIFQAMEVLNFNRKGNSPMVRLLTAAVPFLNARMQGLDVLYRAGFNQNDKPNSKQVQKDMVLRSAAIMAMTVLYYAMTHDDDDYKNQEQETRDNYWLIPKLGIKIPIPFEIGILFKVIPERIMAYSFGDDTGEDMMKSMQRQVMTTLMFNPVPQAAMPLVENWTNYSFFTSRPIVSNAMEGVAPEFQVEASTSGVAKRIGKAIGQSPIKVDHLISGYTGTMGMYMANLLNSVFDSQDDPTRASMRFEQLPVVKRFALDPNAKGTVTSFYDLKHRTDEMVRTINLLEKTGDFEGMARYQMENIKLLATKDYMKSLSKEMKDLNDLKSTIKSSKIDPDSKRDTLTAITQAEIAMTSNIQYLKKLMSGMDL